MNELQIRLSADITALQSALTKAKNTIKSFESETEKESEKGNVGFKRKIGLIEQLTNKAKALRTALSQATNETQVAKYNAQLEETSRELTRLNALGRSVTANLGSTAGGFGQVARQGANANGVAIEFNRIIQDAPFGLIGIGNNLQQLAGNFAQVSKQAGGTSAALKASFSALATGPNIALLAISALTAGFTAYQMGAFDGILATEDFTESLEKFKESLSSVDSARLEGIGNSDKELLTLNTLRGIIESVTKSRKASLDAAGQLQELYPAYFGNLTKEQILVSDLSKTYEALTKTIIAKAKAEASVSKFIELAQEERLILKKTADERARIAEFEDKALKSRIDGQTELQAINENQVRFLTSKIQPELTRINEIKEEQKTLEEDITENLIEANAVLTVQKIKVDDVNKSFDETLAKVELINRLQGDSTKNFNSLASGLSSGLKSELQILENELSKALEGGSNDEVKVLQTKIANVKAVLENFAKDVKDTPIEFNILPEGGQKELGLIQQLQSQIQSISALRDVATDPSRVQAYNEQLKALQNQLGVFTGANDTIRDSNRLVADSFGALGTAIAANLDISNDAVKGFVSTVLSNAPKLIQAIIAQAQASNRAADIANQGNIKQATGNAIVTATAGAKALGPIGLAALPILIGGALALISSAFGKGGGGGSASIGSASSGAPPQIFTNSQIPFIPSNPAPSPSGNIDFDQGQGRLTTTVSGGDIVFVYEREKERQQGGG